MNIRFYNANILTLDGSDIFFGEVQIQNGIITYVGSQKDSAEHSIVWDKQYNLNGNLILPGFKNAHTHSGMTFLRSLADDLPLQDWLYQVIFPAEANITSEDIYLFSKLAILEYLSSGITANFDMYLNPHAIAAASNEYGFRTVICGAINDHVQSLDLLDDCYRKYNQPGSLISYQLGLHAEYTTSREIIEGVSSLAHKYKAPVFLHNSETKKEVAECIHRYGMTPTTFLDNIGLFDFGGGGFHCIYLDDNDINIFKHKNLSIVTNPASNCKLASGIAPLTKYLAEGINVAIGTDGPASNNCLDMFREMFLTTALAKLHDNDASSLDADTVLSMATVNGARAIGLDCCCSLSVGQYADLIVIDMSRPNMQPVNNITKNLVYSGSKENILLTMVHGKTLYENGDFLVGDDIEKLYHDINKRTRELTASIHV